MTAMSPTETFTKFKRKRNLTDGDCGLSLRRCRRGSGGAEAPRVRVEIVADTDASGLSDTEILNAGRYRGVHMVQSAP